MEKEVTKLRNEINNIADRLCLAVKGDFDFTITSDTQDQTVQKLTMLINFVIDSARRAIIEIKEKNDKLNELDRLKSDFIANISHELRTPLTLILAPLDTILRGSTKLPDDIKQNLQRMRRNASRLYMLVNNLLDFSKLEVGKFEIHEESLDLNELLSSLVDDAKGLAHERGLTIKFSSDPKLGHTVLDRKMIEKVVLNLLSNALKFTPSGGKISVTLALKKNQIQITVSDTGIGIPANQVSSIFERFTQIDSSSTRAHEGTGIGLALTHQFIELMQGNIAVESKEKKGTKFIITIPKRDSCALNQKPAAKSDSDVIKVSLSSLSIKEESPWKTSKITSETETPKVLIVDDNRDMQTYLASLLKDFYEVLTADNGKIALDVMKQTRPHVILSDVMMPEMDGYQLTKILKSDSTTRNIPIILVTAKAGSDALASSLEIGADDYLPKPFTPEELIARTNSALTRYQEYLKNCDLNSQLVTVARRAGMADIAASVLHNVGNVLNSINVSLGILQENIKKPYIENLIGITDLINKNLENLSKYLTQDPKGKILPEYLMTLAQEISHNHNKMDQEIHALSEEVNHVKDIVTMQQAISGVSGVAEKLFLPEIINIAVTMCKSSLDHHDIKLEREIGTNLFLVTDKSKLLQIIVNLLQNANDSLSINSSNVISKKISIKLDENSSDSCVRITVNDNGSGIAKENLNKIFTVGFTTKPHGHGFGLHSSALAAKELGGSLHAKSEGPGRGAEFTLTLPFTHPVGRFINEP